MDAIEGLNEEATFPSSASASASASHLVLSMAPLQSGGDAASCATVNATTTTLTLPDDTDCVGGVASVVASMRNLPQDEETLFVPWLDRESVFVQMHPSHLAVNREVLGDYYKSRVFISTHSLLTLEDKTQSKLRTHDMPFLMSNTLIPPSNPWKEYTSMVHFDETTGLAVIYIEYEIKTMGAHMTEGAIGALNYVAVTNEENNCGETGGTCYVPIVLHSVRNPEMWKPFMETMASAKNPPSVLISNYFSSDDESLLVPQMERGMWMVQFPFRNPRLSHSFRIETDPENPLVVTNVTSTGTDLLTFPLTLRGDALAEYQEDQAFLKGLAEVAIQNDPVVGQAGFMPVTRKDSLRLCMGGECPIGNLWTDAIRWGAGDVDIAFAPSGGLRGPGWPAGDVRVSDLYRSMPFANTLCSGVMSGISLFRMLNHSTTMATFDSTYGTNGDQLLQISGARYTYNTELNNTSGSRLISIDVWNRTQGTYRPVERLTMYTFAAENFLCDFFQPFATMLGSGLQIEGEVPAVNDDSQYIQEIVSDYLQKFHSKIPYDTSVQGRLVNNTKAITSMNLVQSKQGCLQGTYWQEHIQTCSICPEKRQVSFSEQMVVLEAPQGGNSLQPSLFAINSDVNDVRIVLSSIPSWVELRVPSASKASFGKGVPIDIPSGEQSVLEVKALAANLDIGKTQGTVHFSVVDDRYPGCFAEHDLLFDVQVKVIPQDDMNHLGPIRAGGLALMSIVMITSVAFAIWTHRNRKARVVRASQPIFLILLCVGAVILSSAIIPLSIDDSVASPSGCNIACMATPWLSSIGFTVVFSALFSKLHRVHKVLTNGEKFRKVAITEKDVLKPFLLLLTLNILFLTIWTIMDPMQWVRLPMSPENPWSTFGTCQSNGPIAMVFSILTLLLNVGALLMACVWSYQTRDIATEYAESKFIGIAIFGMVQVFLVGLPLVFLVSGNPKASYFLLSAIIFTICMSVLLLMFVPKLQQHFKHTSNNSNRDDSTGSTSNRQDARTTSTATAEQAGKTATSSLIESNQSMTCTSRTSTVGLRILSKTETKRQLDQELREYREKVSLLELRLQEAAEELSKRFTIADIEEGT